MGTVLWGYSGEGYIPHNTIIGMDGIVVYNDPGFNLSQYLTMIEAELNKGPSPPANFQLVEVAVNEVTLSWDANIECDFNGYQIRVQDISTDAAFYVDVGNVTEYTVEGLGFNTTYEFSIQGYDQRGNYGSFTDPPLIIVTTPELSTWGIIFLLVGLSVVFFVHRKYQNQVERVHA